MRRGVVIVVVLAVVPWLTLMGLAVMFTGSAAGRGPGCGAAAAGSVSGTDGPALAAGAAYAAGFRGDDLIVAVAIAGAESSYRPTVRNSIGASGLWQILQSAHPHLFERYDWRDPVDNARMAYAVRTDAGSWRPWVTWTVGSYRRHLAEARAAVASLDAAAVPASARPTDAAGSDAGSSPVCPPAAGGLPPAPRPFAGPDGYVDDPTSGGRITGRTLHLYAEVDRAFGGRWPWGVGCWDPHPWNPTSDHPKGRACDFAVGHIGVLPDPDERVVGWQLAHWLQAYADDLGVTYVIWDGRIWSVARSSEGWREYTGGGVYDPSSPTGGHFDHVHVSVS